MEKNTHKSDILENLRKEAEKRIEESGLSDTYESQDKLVYELQLYKTELEMQNEALVLSNYEAEQALSLYTNLYNYAPVGLFNLDKVGIIKDVNLAGTKLFGVNKNKLVNNRFQAYLHPSYIDSFFYFFRRIVDTNQKQTCELKLVKDDGTQIYVILESISFQRGDEGLQEIITAVIDITEKKHAGEALLKAHTQLEQKVKERTQELEAANEILRLVAAEKVKNTQKLLELNSKLLESEQALKELNETKDKFFAIIAHDLRAPFLGLMGFSSMLANKIEKLSKEETVQYAKHIHTLSKGLEKLVEDLLSWSNLQMEAMEFQPKKIEVCKIIHDTIEVFSVNAREKHIEVISNCPSCPCLYADENMVKSIFRNLTSNAIKFTKENGKISFTVEDAKDYVTIKVSDTGVGMSSRVIDRLFQIDRPTASTGTANEKGTGLGLLLCKEFVEKHGGKLWFETQIGKGTTFFFTLPRELKN